MRDGYRGGALPDVLPPPPTTPGPTSPVERMKAWDFDEAGRKVMPVWWIPAHERPAIVSELEHAFVAAELCSWDGRNGKPHPSDHALLAYWVMRAKDR